MQSGIYQIKQLSTGLIYIGSSRNIQKRWREHRRALSKGLHYNPRLQSAWLSGELDFEFLVIEECQPEKLVYLEQFFLDTLKPWVPTNGFNVAQKVERFSLGLKRSPETRKKLSLALSGPKHPNWGKPANAIAHAKTMAKVRGKKRPNCGKRRVFSLRSPSGERIQFDGVRRFCRIHGLNSGNISSVLNGKLPSHKGWKV